jgi:hypothetical protein
VIALLAVLIFVGGGIWICCWLAVLGPETRRLRISPLIFIAAIFGLLGSGAGAASTRPPDRIVPSVNHGTTKRHPSVPLKLTVTGTGTIRLGQGRQLVCAKATCSRTFMIRKGSWVTLTAIPAATAGWRFTGWDESGSTCTLVTAACLPCARSLTPACRLHVVAGVGLTLSATFFQFEIPLGQEGVVGIFGEWRLRVLSAATANVLNGYETVVVQLSATFPGSKGAVGLSWGFSEETYGKYGPVRTCRGDPAPDMPQPIPSYPLPSPGQTTTGYACAHISIAHAASLRVTAPGPRGSKVRFRLQ